MTYLDFLPRFHRDVAAGRKTATARLKVYGTEGDVVQSPVGPLVIQGVQEVPLHYVKDACWRQEGLSSPQEFVEVWKACYPARGYDPDDRVFLHRFRLAGGTRKAQTRMAGKMPSKEDLNYEVRGAVVRVIREKGTVTADDLHDELPDFPGDARQFGAVLRSLEKEGRLVKVGYEPSRRPQCHGRPILRFREPTAPALNHPVHQEGVAVDG